MQVLRRRVAMIKMLSVLAIIAVVAIGATALYYVAGLGSSQGESSMRFDDNEPSMYSFGNYAPSNTSEWTGWLMPASTLVSTSFVMAQNINQSITVSNSLYPYQLGQNATIYIGLYINGQLGGNSTSDMSDTHAHPASMIGQPLNSSAGETARFSASTESYGAAYSFDSLPAGTTVTITMFVTAPIWIQVATDGTPSYEVANTVPLPSILPGNALSTNPSGVTLVPSTLDLWGDTFEA
jgi:hypothetical protein